MQSSAAATIRDGSTLCYNSDFAIEMTLLLKGAEAVRKDLGNLRGKYNWEAVDQLEEAARQPLILPSGDEERYQRGLGLVHAIGRAAGQELNGVDYCGEHEPLCRVFRQGMMSNPDKVIIGSTLERAFFECGIGASVIAFGIVGEAGVQTRESFLGVLEDASRAFVTGLQEEVA